ncbi:hypothetical protein [Micromonospora sp. LOL_021]|uniref:hypothetical protein n=1 Tax=Micromonospora sp. LOL_021 TaxID=3345417 RepID=UPI003A8BFE74
MSDIAVLAHQSLLFGEPPSESTVRRALAGLDEKTLKWIGRARAKVRAHVWVLLARRPQGLPWLSVAGKLLTRWVIIDLDATLITAHSDRQGVAATLKTGVRVPSARRLVLQHRRMSGHVAQIRERRIEHGR